MSVRAKFRCLKVEDYGQSKKISLSVVTSGPCGGDSAENRSFTQWTPSGEIWMTVDNPHASVQFVEGREYYVDFSEASQPAEAE